jgi:hypothetical protein
MKLTSKLGKRIGLAAVALGAPLAAIGAFSATAYANTQFNGAMLPGFDSATNISVTQMQYLWNQGYRWVGVYMGGQNNGGYVHSAAWFNAVEAQGWFVEPIWVGLQSSNSNCGCTAFSNDANTAYYQGQNSAHNFWWKLDNTGFNVGAGGVPMVVDIEAFMSKTVNGITTYASSQQQNAAKAYVDGFCAEIGRQYCGVYGSTYESNITGFATKATNVSSYMAIPGFIWGATYTQTSTGAYLDNPAYMPPIPNGDWSNGTQRLMQYQGGHSVYVGSYNTASKSYYVNIDSDTADGPIYSNY